MRRRFLTAILGAALVLGPLLPAPVLAGQVEDSIVRQLRAQGFSRIEVTRTLLGRVRILARSEALRREIVFDPRTGEILRDYWVESGERRPGGLLDPAGVGDDPEPGENGDDGGDDDADDDGDDDDADDDDDDSGDDDGDDDDGGDDDDDD